MFPHNIHRCGYVTAPYRCSPELSNIFRVEDGNVPDAYDRYGFCVKIDPVKPAVFGIRVDLEERTCVPALLISKLLVQKNLDAVTDLKISDHYFFRFANQNKPAPSTSIIPPMIAHFGSPAMAPTGKILTPCKKKISPGRNNKILTALSAIFMFMDSSSAFAFGDYTRFHRVRADDRS